MLLSCLSLTLSARGEVPRLKEASVKALFILGILLTGILGLLFSLPMQIIQKNCVKYK